MGKRVRWIFRLFLVVTSLLFIFICAVTFLKIPLDLTRFKEPLETMASDALERPVRIEKSIVLSTSLKPVFTLEGLRISNTKDFSQDTFLYLDSAKIQVELLPLLKKKLYITEFLVNTLDVNLEENSEGAVNWVRSAADKSEGGSEKEPVPPQGGDKPVAKKGKSFEITSDSVVVRKLLFENIGVTFYQPGEDQPAGARIEKCTGAMIPGEPLNLDIEGKVNEFPYTFRVKLASLEEFLTENKTWMELDFAISETLLSFAGEVDLAQARQSLALRSEVSGDDLSSLNDLLKLDLPPLKKYGISANIILMQDHFDLESLEIRTGTSSLKGKAHLSRGDDQVSAEINFKSPLIQLDDFIFEGWSWSGAAAEKGGDENEEPETQPDKKEESDIASPTGTEVRKLTDPELLAQIDAHIGIKAEKVISGEDQLGSGSVEVSLLDGRLAIEPLQLNLPGGSATFSASLAPGEQGAKAEVKAVVENFDIGILVRRSKPESDMEGLVNLDVHLSSTASSLDQVLANGNGYFDFSGQLKNLKAGIIDLWAVDLVAAIVSSTDENASQINCAIGRWTVKDGLLTPDAFFIDTSKIRICGTGKVDFKNNEINLAVSPTPKSAQFFSLATPIAVQGSFGDLDFGIKSGGIFGTAVRFVVSPVTVPIKRVFLEGAPEDGSDVCTVQLGPENREEITVKGCR